jgi:hypothetical protein
MGEDTVLMRTRWELATLAGRLRNLEAEREDMRTRQEELERDRDRSRDLVRSLRRSRAYRVGRALVSMAGPTARIVRRMRDQPVTPDRRQSGATAKSALPTHVYVAIGLRPEVLQEFTR